MEGKTIHLFGYFEVNSRKNRAIGRWATGMTGLLRLPYVLFYLLTDGICHDMAQAVSPRAVAVYIIIKIF